MTLRATLLAVIGLLVVGVAGTVAWRAIAPAGATAEAEDLGPLPVPPIPPRIAEGEDYDRCLSMLGSDPSGALSFADAWEATGGGGGASHCRALAEVALGDAGEGAEDMEKLASGSSMPGIARASIYGQAGQAWLIAGEADRAFAATTLALALTPDDPDLLIDRAIAAGTLERYDDAVDDLSHALDLEPRRPDALVLRSAAWRHTGQIDLAQDDIDRAFALDPDNAEALLERGILRQRHGDRAGARADWQRAVELAPDSATGDLAQQNLALLEAGPERR